MNTKEEKNKKFHFQEINKIIDFPKTGNQGKYATYHVRIKTLEKANQQGETIILGEFLDNLQLDGNFSLTVGYYKDSTGEGPSFCPEYLELRKIFYVDDFWLFLNSCDL